MSADTVHIDDVASLHVEALDPGIEVGESGYRNFGANSHGFMGMEWDSAIDIVKKHLPSAERRGSSRWAAARRAYIYHMMRGRRRGCSVGSSRVGRSKC